MDDLEERLQSFVTVPNQGIVLGLERVEVLLKKLGNPHLQLPRIIHVGGTNGKGSTIAFMRAMLEAAGQRVHVFTSPHLIRFNERIRIAGQLATDAQILNVFEEIARVNDGAPITYFEMTAVAAFVLFSRTPADVLLLEVGLGGRLDATNVITPAVSVITRISYDHMHLLGDTLEKIACEKAGIIKPGAPCVMAYQADAAVKQVIRARAAQVNAPLHEYGKNFITEELPDGFSYNDKKYPPPALLGAHQILNAANAIAAVRLFLPEISEDAIVAGLKNVEWPGRLQRITQGRLIDMLPDGAELWYDGAHNDSGADALAEQCRRWQSEGAEIHLILGILRHKRPAEFIARFKAAGCIADFICMPGLGAEFWSAADLVRIAPILRTPADWDACFVNIGKTQQHFLLGVRRIFVITGSLYLAERLDGLIEL